MHFSNSFNYGRFYQYSLIGGSHPPTSPAYPQVLESFGKRRHRSYVKRNIVTSVIFATWQHASQSWSSSVHLGPHFGERRGRRGQRWRHSKERFRFPYTLSIVTIALSLTIRSQFASDYLRRSNQQACISLEQNLEGKVDRCKPNCNAIWKRQGTVVCKRNRVWTFSYSTGIVDVTIFCRLSTMHERDRQTEKHTDHGTVISIAIGEIASGRCRLIIYHLYLRT